MGRRRRIRQPWATTLMATRVTATTKTKRQAVEQKFADIIAVSSSPLEDIEELLDVDFVMKGGKVYKD